MVGAALSVVSVSIFLPAPVAILSRADLRCLAEGDLFFGNDHDAFCRGFRNLRLFFRFGDGDVRGCRIVLDGTRPLDATESAALLPARCFCRYVARRRESYLHRPGRVIRQNRTRREIPLALAGPHCD